MRRDRQPTCLSPETKAHLAAYVRAHKNNEPLPERSDAVRAELRDLARLRRSRNG